MPARVKDDVAFHDMPVDTILLGASPPGFGHCFQAGALTYLHDRVSSHNRVNMGIGMKGDLLMQMNRNSRRRMPLRSCIKQRSESTSNGTSSFVPLSPKLSTRPKIGRVPNSPRLSRANCVENGVSLEKKKKQVTFADARGFSLQTVKYMDGPSSEPPRLRIHLLQEVIQNEEAKPTHPYTYVPEFEQPASNYLEFRGRLDKANVCLENVLIKDNITLVGTIKVKNIAFEKSVIVRVTFDEWKTSQDIEASYVSPGQPSGSREKYDTFAFSIDMPPNLGGRNFEFCICYNANHQAHWDNNHGNNYKIVTEKDRGHVQEEERDSFQHLTGDFSYGQFSYWQITQDNERPYW